MDVVIRSTGFFTDKDKAAAHLAAGAKGWLFLPRLPAIPKPSCLTLTTVSSTEVRTIISCTKLHLKLAPMAKALQDNFGIVTGLMGTIHALYTNDQNTLDAPASQAISGHAAASNIVPNSTGAARPSAWFYPN